MFVCKNISTDYCLKDIGFELQEGYILGVIGRNGSGKTTLLKTLMGLTRSDDEKCSIEIDGISIDENPVEYRRRIGYVLNETPFNTDLSAMANARLYGKYYQNFDIKRYEELLLRYHVIGEKNCLRKEIKALSAGQRIRQQLAFVKSYNPQVIFMDEPTANLDVEFRDEFYNEMRDMVADEKRSIVYVTHLVEELEHFADYIMWIREQGEKSEIYFYGTIDELRDTFRLVLGEEELLRQIPRKIIAGERKKENHSEVLIKVDDRILKNETIMNNSRYCDLREIMYYVG